MRYAFMTFSTPDLPLADTLALARRLGYAGIEPRTESGHRHGVELDTTADQRTAIRATAEENGVAIACIALSSRLADPQEAAAHVEKTHAGIDLAGDVGCGRLRVFGGAFQPAHDRARAIDTFADSLRSLADHAAERGVAICVETHDAWCDPADVATVMERVNHPAIGVNWDVLHTQRVAGHTPQQAVDRLRPWIRHVHVHDGRDENGRLRILPIGAGDIDHAAVLRVLAAMDYDGFVSGEWIGGMMDPAFFANHLGPELQTLRRLESFA